MNRKIRCISLLLLALSGNARAQVLTFDFLDINEAIPDGNPAGLASFQTIHSAPDLLVANLTVSLSISGTGFGGYNGDLYATLQHESGFAVLLNRPGRRSDSSSGYNDSGLNVTFADSATRDVHNYRLELNGSHDLPITGSLSGSWSPDARTEDPALVSDASVRPAFLESFNGTSVNGDWTLFVSDLSAGGTHQLDSWSMQVTPVPEPASFALAAALGLLGFALWRRLHKAR